MRVAIIMRWQCTGTLFNTLTLFLTMRTITNDDFTADWSRQDSEMEQVLDVPDPLSTYVPVIQYIQCAWEGVACETKC
jgi:hypothetical protein